MAKAVTGKAATYCIFGSRPSVLLVPDGHDIQLNGNNRANVSDRIPIANIFPFGLCCSPFNPAVIAAFGIPQPCLPLTPLPWYPGNDTIILEGEKGLDDTCLNCCIWCGIIFFLYAGQDKWNVSDAVTPSQAADASKLMTEKIEAFKQTPEGQAMLAKAEADYTEMMAVHDALCPSAKPAVKTCTNGEPVNVVNGQELLQQTDFSIPGLIPFTWTRTYRSGNLDKNSPVGFGWSVKYGDYIKTGIKKTVYVDSEGREIPFDTPEVGKTFKNMYELATLSRPDKESYEILFDDGRRLSFTGDKNIKHLISEKDIYGNSLDFTYNKKNQLESVFSSGIKVASFKFDKNNRISSISRVNRKGKEFQAVKYDYSKQGDLIKVTDACGKSESFEYENHLFTKRTLKTGFNFYFTWDKYAPDGKCLRSFGDDNIFDTKFKYFPEERYTEVTDGRGITRTYCYDRMENIRKYIDGKGGVTTYVYDGRDNPVIVTDPEGNVKTTLYNEFGSISKTVDPEGTETDFKYNESGQLVEIAGPNESTAKREYNETGDLKKSTAPDGSETHYKYNSSGLPVKISDHFGNSKTMVWDEFGRLTSEMDESGNKTEFAYDDLGNLASVTDIDGTTDYTYDPMGRILTITDPLKRVTKLSYNEYGEHETVIDPYGDKRTYIYNGLSKVVSETDPNGKTTTFLYDKEMNVVETVTTAGSEKYTQVNGYDEEENIINTEIRKNGKTALSESCEYDKAGNMLLYTDGNVTEKYKYDKAGRKIKQTVKIGDEEITTAFTYFEDGNLETLKGPEETVTSFEYDKTGRPAKITVPDGTFYENKYSLAGPEEQKDRHGRKNLYTYNSKGRVETVTNPNGEITEYTYNAAGQITKLTDANGNSTFWEYDRKGRVTDKSFSNGSRLTYEYNKKGQLSKKTDAEGKTVEYNYDERDRLSKITYSKDEPVEFKYNSKGALVSMSDASGKTLFDHDATGRLVNVNGPLNDDSVSYTYDDLGRKQEMKLNGVTMSTYSYDELGRISKVTAGENLYEYKYKLLGSDIESVSRNGKLLIKKEFDKLGRTKKQFEYFSDGEPLADNHYFYNNADMMTARIDTNDITAQFQYDMAGRLAEVEKYHDTGYMKRTFPLSESYFYDKMGNREKAVTQYNHSEFNYKNNSLNQYTVFSDNMNRIMHTAYDQNGNMTKIPLDSETTMVCEYDGENRLASIRKQNTKIINTYDGFGRRKIKEVYAFNDRAEWIPQTRTEFIYDGWNLISERKYKTNNLSTLGDQQPTTSHYFWGLDVSGSLGGTGGVGGLLQLAVGSNSPYITKKEEKEPGTEIFGPAGSSLQSPVSSLQSGCSIYFPHYDHIGNIIAYTNESEEIAAVYDYSGFGELIRSDGPMKEDFSLQFSTKYIDKETNLYYYGYRFYNPQMGNWLSREPMGESESINLYTFINNDSINAIDVLGLYAKDVHFYLNYYMARYIGLDKTRATDIATAAQYVDNSPKTPAMDPTEITARHKYHFPSKNTGFLWFNRTYRNDPLVREALSKQNNDVAFGVYLHIYEDTYAHEGYGKVWGHLYGFYDPDRPWVHQVREEEMARHVYESMTEFAKSTGLGSCKLKNKSFEDFWNKTKDTLFVNHYDELSNRTVDSYIASSYGGGLIKTKSRELSAAQIAKKEEEMRCDDWQDLIKKDFNEDIKYDKTKVGKDFIKKFDNVIKDVPDWHNEDK